MTRQLTFDGWTADLVTLRLERDGEVCSLTTRESGLLAELARHPGEVVSRDALYERVWGYHPNVQSRAVDSTVARLRRKIERDPKNPAILITVYGQGYRLLADPFEDSKPVVAPVGRAQLLTQLAERDGPVVLVGPPGVGKSLLAQAHAMAHSNQAIVIDLTNIGTTDGLLSALSDGIEGLGPASDVRFAQKCLAEARHPVVLDNADGVVSILEHWPLPDTAMVTARRPLTTARVVRVPGLTIEAGTTLLRARTPETVSDEDASQIVSALDGHPLAILLAAGRLSVVPAATLIEQLEAGAVPLRDERHSLEASIRAAVEHLSPDHRDHLVSLCAMPHGASLAGAAAVWECPPDKALERLAHLVERSLVRTDVLPGGSARYTVYRSVWAYIRASHPVTEGVKLRRDRFLAEWARDRIMAHSWNRSVLTELALERHGLDAALASSVPEVLEPVAIAIDILASARGPLGSGRAALDHALRTAPTDRLRLASAESHRTAGRLDAARRDLESIDNPTGWVRVRCLTIRALMDRMTGGSGIALHEEAFAGAEALGDPLEICMRRINLAGALVRTDPERGSAMLYRGLSEARALDNLRAEGLALSMLARYWDGRDRDQALSLREEALSLAETLDDGRFGTGVAVHLAHQLAAQGQVDRAEALYHRALSWGANNAGQRGIAWLGLELLARLDGDADAARQALFEAERHMRPMASTLWNAALAVVLSAQAADRDQLEVAEAQWSASDVLAGDPEREVRGVHLALARCRAARRQGDTDGAEAALAEAEARLDTHREAGGVAGQVAARAYEAERRVE